MPTTKRALSAAEGAAMAAARQHLVAMADEDEEDSELGLGADVDVGADAEDEDEDDDFVKLPETGASAPASASAASCSSERVIPKTAAEERKIFIDMCRNKHARRKKYAAQKGHVAPPAFKVRDVTGSAQYKAILDSRLYLHGFMMMPPTAPHLLSTCRRISFSDMAHAKGYYGGNLAYRYTMDANHHAHLLAGGYFLDNEKEETHRLANDFLDINLPQYDTAVQVDISDLDKGAHGGFKHSFSLARAFGCHGHFFGPQGLIGTSGKDAKSEMYCAAKACTLEDLSRAKGKFGPKAQSCARKYPDELLNVAAMQVRDSSLSFTTTSL